MDQKEFGDDMSDIAISDVRREHQTIIQRLMTGPGDSEGAMRRAESMFGLGYWSQWNLRYKRQASKPFAQKVRTAYLSLLERSVRRDLEALKTEQARDGGADDLESLVVEAETLLARIKAARKV